MARKGITFSQVAEVCKSLQEADEPISVRSIQARTGGSMTTVLKHYRRWKEGGGNAPAVKEAISRRLQQALLAELRQTAARTRETCTAETLRVITELKNRLAESERHIRELENCLLENDRLRLAQEEMLRQLRLDLAEAERSKNLAEARLAELEEKPFQDDTAQASTRNRKSRTDKKELPSQEPNLFDF